MVYAEVRDRGREQGAGHSSGSLAPELAFPASPSYDLQVQNLYESSMSVLVSGICCFGPK